MTAESQSVTDMPSKSSGSQGGAHLVEDPAVALRALLEQKAKNNQGLHPHFSLHTGDLLPTKPGTQLKGSEKQLIKDSNGGPGAVHGHSPDFLDMGTAISLYKVGERHVPDQPGVHKQPIAKSESPLSIQLSKDARELELLRQYFHTGDMTNPLVPNHKPGEFDSEKYAFQHKLQTEKQKSGDSSKRQHDADEQVKPGDAATGGRDTGSKDTGAKAPADAGTVSVDQGGTKTTAYKNGAVRVERKDGSGYTLTPNADGTFSEHKWATEPVHFWQTDVNKHPDRVLTADQAMSERHEQLVADAKLHIHDKKELDKFEADLTKLEQRAKKDGVSPAQLAQMYGSVDTLITSTATAPTDQGQRLKLAEQIMNQAADYKQIHQGEQNTCGAADMEVAAYLNHPEAAARMVTDVALTGQYTAYDGTKIKVDPQPHGESRQDNDGNNRSYASEIFQVGAINVALKIDAKFEGKHRDFQYSQTDNGETVSETVGGKTRTGDNGHPLYPGEAVATYQAITGDKSMGVIEQHNGAKPGDVIDQWHQVKSEQELNHVLANAKLPIMVVVNVDNQPFDQPVRKGNGYEDRDDRGHMVIVTGYEPGPPAKVTVYNSQGADAPLGKGGEISVHDLYRATLARPDSIKELRKDIAEEKSHGHVDTAKQLELIRLEIEQHQLSKKDAEREVKGIISQMPADEQRKFSPVLKNIAGELDIADVSTLAPALTN